MGCSVLNARSTRRIARSTDQKVIRAWSHGGYVFGFVTDDHRHGWWSKKDSSWGWEAEPVTHYASCHEQFPDW